MYSGGVMTNLDTLGDPYTFSSIGTGINASGEVVGYGAHMGLGGPIWHAFLYTGSGWTDLGTLGGSGSWATGINASGQVVGYSDAISPRTPAAFLYSNGAMTNLGALGCSGTTCYSYAYGINDSGEVVGVSSSFAPFAPAHAFLYSGGIMLDLNSLLPANSGWVLQQAGAINDSGQIVGYGTFDGQTHGFLLDTGSPIPEPSSLPLLSAGLALVATMRRRKTAH
jgi:probable HAF family extracellular repeat protein